MIILLWTVTHRCAAHLTRGGLAEVVPPAGPQPGTVVLTTEQRAAERTYWEQRLRQHMLAKGQVDANIRDCERVASALFDGYHHRGPPSEEDGMSRVQS